MRARLIFAEELKQLRSMEAEARRRARVAYPFLAGYELEVVTQHNWARMEQLQAMGLLRLGPSGRAEFKTENGTWEEREPEAATDHDHRAFITGLRTR